MCSTSTPHLRYLSWFYKIAVCQIWGPTCLVFDIFLESEKSSRRVGCNVWPKAGLRRRKVNQQIILKLQWWWWQLRWTWWQCFEDHNGILIACFQKLKEVFRFPSHPPVPHSSSSFGALDLQQMWRRSHSDWLCDKAEWAHNSIFKQTLLFVRCQLWGDST